MSMKTPLSKSVLSAACLSVLAGFCLFTYIGAQSQPCSIVTVAGGGSVIFNNVPATQAVVPQPRAVATDGIGNLYIATDYYVFKVDTSGILTILAGTTDQYAKWSDNVPATSTPVGVPVLDVAADPVGNVYILEEHRVRKIDAATGIIHTVAGTGTEGFSGDGGPATLAQLNTIVWDLHLRMGGVTVDTAGNLFIADAGNNRIRRVDAATQIITTVAGNGTYGYSGDGGPATSAALKAPAAVAVDAWGNIYIADRENLRVRRVASNGTIATYVGTGTWWMCSAGPSGDGGPATSFPLQEPGDVISDAAGHLLVRDGCGYGVWMVDPGTQIITRVAGRGIPGSWEFSGDGGPALGAGFGGAGLAYGPDGRYYIADFPNNRVRVVDTAGIISTVAGNGEGNTTYGGDGGAATEAVMQLDDGSGAFGSRSAVALDSLGNLYLSDTFNWAVRRVDHQTKVITTVANGKLPSGLAVDILDRLYIADTYNQVIRRFDPSDDSLAILAGNGFPTSETGPDPHPFQDGVPATSTSLCYPSGVAVDTIGNIYIADTLNNRIRKVDTTGIINTVVSLNHPQAVVVMPDGTLYVAEPENSRITRVATDGTTTTAAWLTEPIGLAVNASGILYAASATTHRVYRCDPATPSVQPTVLAGTGSEGFSGDGGLPVLAALHSPTDVAVAPDGTIYVADSGNNRIRAFLPDVQPPVLAVPPAVTANATGPAGAVVSDAQLGTATATDDCGNTVVTRSGVPTSNLFPIGTTIITYTATDSGGNVSSGNQLVTVTGADAQISDLISKVNGMNLIRGITTSLLHQLDQAHAFVASGSPKAASSMLKAFIKEVNAQSGRRITVAQAGQLIADATRIKAVLGYP